MPLAELSVLYGGELIATIMNPRQGGAILEACEKEAKRKKIPRLGVEGGPQSTWILLDYGSLVVHLFLPEQRAYYALEHIWSDAKRKDTHLGT